MASSNEYMFDISRSINFQFTTPFYAVIQSCALALMYVGSLYINASPFPRLVAISYRFMVCLHLESKYFFVTLDHNIHLQNSF